MGRYDGIAAVVEILEGHPQFAHVTLAQRTEPHCGARHRPAGGIGDPIGRPDLPPPTGGARCARWPEGREVGSSRAERWSGGWGVSAGEQGVSGVRRALTRGSTA
ncbi:hypothetical protein MOPEL_078_00030 [Mobilicoccus pelagius NBRC 104925]|uniref:Uncharacterized protein n=1 Tax=Mobilicoccus pelagius NBRC 104925 TaxID=1089455 RepID=H5USA6_9MICO|nr:hypothetical protein MOPEL_078_00030 [Mobilicoccus pelagius NBRC 104925]